MNTLWLTIPQISYHIHIFMYIYMFTVSKFSENKKQERHEEKHPSVYPRQTVENQRFRENPEGNQKLSKYVLSF